MNRLFNSVTPVLKNNRLLAGLTDKIPGPKHAGPSIEPHFIRAKRIDFYIRQPVNQIVPAVIARLQIRCPKFHSAHSKVAQNTLPGRTIIPGAIYAVAIPLADRRNRHKSRHIPGCIDAGEAVFQTILRERLLSGSRRGRHRPVPGQISVACFPYIFSVRNRLCRRRCNIRAPSDPAILLQRIADNLSADDTPAVAAVAKFTHKRVASHHRIGHIQIPFIHGISLRHKSRQLYPVNFRIRRLPELLKRLRIIIGNKKTVSAKRIAPPGCSPGACNNQCLPILRLPHKRRILLRKRANRRPALPTVITSPQSAVLRRKPQNFLAAFVHNKPISCSSSVHIAMHMHRHLIVRKGLAVIL